MFIVDVEWEHSDEREICGCDLMGSDAGWAGITQKLYNSDNNLVTLNSFFFI